MKKNFRYLFSCVIILALWQVLSINVDKGFIARPYDTFKTMIDLLAKNEIQKHIFSSAYRIVMGTVCGVIFAFPIGLLIGCSDIADTYLGNIFNILYPIPKVVFLPIIVVGMGIGDKPKIFLIALVVGFQLVLNIRDAVHHIPEELIRSMRSLDPTYFQYMIHLVIPACLPEIFTSLRSTIGISTALLFITENFASVTGLGYYITRCMDSRDFAEMYSGIIAIALLGFLLNVLIMVCEKRICRWKYL